MIYKTVPQDKMTPYERMMAVLAGKKETIDRLLAFSYNTTYTIHSMEIFDAYWPEAHKNPEKMAKLGAALHELTGLECVNVPFELTLEAEALGIELEFFEGKIKWPSVRRYWVKKVEDLKIPERPEEMRERGRVPVVCEAIKILKKRYEGKVPIIASIDFPYQAIGGYIVDTSTWYKYMRSEPKVVHSFMSVLTPLFTEVAVAYLEAGADVVTYREEASSLANIHPKTFREFVMPYLKDSIARARKYGRVILHCCGNLWSPTVENVSGLIECDPNALTVEEATPMIKVREIANKLKGPLYPIGGNLSAFETLYKGPIEKIRDRVKKAIEEGCDMVAPGCDIWLETPTEHIKAFVNAVIEFGTPPPWSEEGVEKWLPKGLRGT
ncbi:MAG: uroporphyrinogen decarboxylase family protein [Nitrososphaerales archaeon]